jgi:hypothetical protein
LRKRSLFKEECERFDRLPHAYRYAIMVTERGYAIRCGQSRNEAKPQRAMHEWQSRRTTS